jgi:hypothetical protein
MSNCRKYVGVSWCTCLRVWRQTSATTLAPTFISATQHRNTKSQSTVAMLPEEIIVQLNAEFQCREQQIQHLAALYTVRASPFATNKH